jgi:hypothetical protein
MVGCPDVTPLASEADLPYNWDWILQDWSTFGHADDTLPVLILQAGGFEAGQLGFSRGIASDSSSNRNNQAIITPASRKKPVERGSGENLTCDHDSCNYKGTFP